MTNTTVKTLIPPMTLGGIMVKDDLPCSRSAMRVIRIVMGALRSDSLYCGGFWACYLPCCINNRRKDKNVLCF